jgi:transcriptional regulator with XRE-family HTH domain
MADTGWYFGYMTETPRNIVRSEESRSVKANGRLVRELRKKRGMTQSVFADAAGLSQRSLQRIEGGKEGVMPNALRAVANALEVPIVQLLADTERAENLQSACPEHEIIRFTRTMSAREIAWLFSTENVICRCDMDPDEEAADIIAALFEEAGALGESAYNVKAAEAAQKIRLMGKVNSKLRTLAERGIYVFAAAYMHRNIDPDLDMVTPLSENSEGKREAHEFATPELRRKRMLVVTDHSASTLDKEMYVGFREEELVKELIDRVRRGVRIKNWKETEEGIKRIRSMVEQELNRKIPDAWEAKEFVEFQDPFDREIPF